MKLSFSTRGRLNTPWAELVGMAKENGFSGIEILRDLNGMERVVLGRRG